MAQLLGAKTAVSTLVSLFVLSFLLITASSVQFAAAKSQSTQIGADGNIVSTSESPLQRDGNIYYLTGNSGPLFVYRSNIVLDGRGYTIEGADPNSQGTNDFGGIYLSQVENVTIENFIIKKTWFGLSLDYCTNVAVVNNTISGIWHPLPLDRLPAGVIIRGGYSNNLTGNRFEDNTVGLLLWEETKNNLIVGNTIMGSVKEGIRLAEASGNMFYHNNFQNSKNVYDLGCDSGRGARSVNVWTDGQEGNFWNDYNGSDSNSDGIGDTDYLINLQNADDFPLIEPFNQTYYTLKTTAPKITLISPINGVYNQTDVHLTFTSDKPLSLVSYSLNNEANVMINGNQTSIPMLQGTHNFTLYAIDEFGNTGVSQTVTFTVTTKEAAFSLALIAVTLFVLVIAIVCIGLVLYLRKRKHLY